MYEELLLYLEEMGYLDIFSDLDRSEYFFQNLTSEQFKSIVIGFNKMLRGLGDDEDNLSTAMVAGDLVAPTSDIWDLIIDNLVNALKDLNDNKDRALLIYYSLINLHMFSDGNGRTARVLYDLICNELGNSSYYIHGDKEVHSYNIDFETFKNIPDISYINSLANSNIITSVLPYLGEFEECVIDKYVIVGLGNFSFVKDVMPNTISEQLTDEELEKLEITMCDSLGVNYTVSGLSFLCMALKKGQLQDWISLDNDLCQKYGDPFNGGRLCFRVRKASSLLDEWTADDYRELIDFGNYFKLEQFRATNKLFLDNAIVDNKSDNKTI